MVQSIWYFFILFFICTVHSVHTDSGANYIVVQICTHLHFRKVKLCKSSPLHNFQLLNLEVVQPVALPQKLCKTHSKLCKCAKYCGTGQLWCSWSCGANAGCGTVQLCKCGTVGSLCSRLQCHRCLLGATLATLNIKWLANALRHCHTHMEESEEKDENDDNDGNAGINEEYHVSAL